MLDKNSPIPLYYQLQTIIEAHIDNGEWRPGMLVPSERELCEQFDVSRITVRQALATLAHQGRLIRRQGRGTFVAVPRIEQQLGRLTGFTQEMQRRGQRPGGRVLRQTVIPVSFPVANALGLELEEPVVLVKRVRLAEGEPVALETAHIPKHLCPGLAERRLEDRSLYNLLEREYEIVPAKAEQQIEALPCPAPEARVLGVPRGAPMLHMIRVTFRKDGSPFEYTESYYRGDRYTFQVVLTRPEGTNSLTGMKVARKG